MLDQGACVADNESGLTLSVWQSLAHRVNPRLADDRLQGWGDLHYPLRL